MEIENVVLLARRSAAERNRIARSFGGEMNKITRSFGRKGIEYKSIKAKPEKKLESILP